MGDKPGDTMVGEDLGACPFCGGQIAYSMDERGPNGVIHSQPMCDRFIRLDPIAFMTAVRKEVERTQPS